VDLSCVLRFDPARRAVLAERDDEWQDGRCHFRPESLVLVDALAETEEVGPALLTVS